jgi:hypothetical protein
MKCVYCGESVKDIPFYTEDEMMDLCCSEACKELQEDENKEEEN